MSRSLEIDPRRGMSSRAVVAALLGLGLPEPELLAALRAAGEALGWVEVHTHLDFMPDGTAGRRLHVSWLERPVSLSPATAPELLEEAMGQAGVGGEYAALARRMVSLWIEAQQPDRTPPRQTVSLTVIGRARTPYRHTAPYQPDASGAEDETFYIELDPQFATGLESLETFGHLFVVSFLDRSQGYELVITPPWQDHPRQRGLFATRAPNRPSAIGLTRTRLRRVVGNRVYTGPLDLFDGTPVLDLKPFIRSLDGETEAERVGLERGNDGWLAGSDHLELHRRGIPHAHPGQVGPQRLEDVLLDAVGVAWGLQWLGVDLKEISLVSSTTGSLTPGSAALLAALQPVEASPLENRPGGGQAGVGLGEPLGNEDPGPVVIVYTRSLVEAHEK